MNSCKTLWILRNSSRKFGTKIKQKPIVILDDNVNRNIQEENYKPRKHPGVIKPKNIELPEKYIKAIINTIEDIPIKQLLADSETFIRHLRFRLPPIEKDELQKKFSRFYKKACREVKQESPTLEEEDAQRFNQSIKDKVNYLLKQNVYNWTPTNYNDYNSLLYLVGRAAPDYAVLVRIFSEIKLRDPSFKPRSLFDFGSGIGTGTWAANFCWKDSIFEYFNVDASAEMNDLARVILQGGRGTKQMSLKGVFYRQFLPSALTPYDLVISAYSLLELPSLDSRLETIKNLWDKTKDYLVLVEYGTNAGFKVITEARDFILQMEGENNKGHTFSPCPHNKICPRLSEDDTPCNFQVMYQTLPFRKPLEHKTELFCYVVLKKGERNSEVPQWPRVVRETLIRSKHSICRLCTEEGKLEEIIFTASKHGKTTYHCARSTKWGDLLPITIKKTNDDRQS